MIAVAGLEALLASPKGGYFTGPLSVSFIVDPALVGAIVWGRPTADQIMDLVRSHERMRPHLAAETGALVDVRHLEWPEPAAYSAVVTHLAERRDWLAEYIVRLALVHAESGPVGAAGAGFFQLAARPFAVQTFTKLRAALEWIGRSDAAALETELESIFAEASRSPALLRSLRAVLEARPGALSLGSAAHALGVTERSLQRWLKSWGSTFQAESSRAQVRVAERLLRHTDAPLAQVASEVGCASLSHFSALFKRVTNEAPSDWRRRHR